MKIIFSFTNYNMASDSDQCHFNMACWYFFAQVIFSLITVLFCMCMIAFEDAKLEVFLPLLTSTVSVWIPSPTPPKKTVGGSPPSSPTPST